MTKSKRNLWEALIILENCKLAPGTFHEGEWATVVEHKWNGGDVKYQVRNWKAVPVQDYHEGPSVDILMIWPGHRRWHLQSYSKYTGGYITIEHDGVVLYNSRKDVPPPVEELATIYPPDQSIKEH